MVKRLVSCNISIEPNACVVWDQLRPAGMEEMEVVLLRHFVMDQMYALLVRHGEQWTVHLLGGKAQYFGGLSTNQPAALVSIESPMPWM